MGSEWPVVSLGEVVNLKRGYDLAAGRREPGNVPIISSSGPSGIHSKAIVQAPGVVTGRYGTIGLVHYVETPFWPLNTTLYVQDFKGNDPRFIYYLLKTINYRDYLDKAAVPGINRNDVHRARVSLPPATEQKSIANALVCLDEKIRLIQDVSTTLEAIARAMFKSWFVDFDPVRAKAEGREPEGMDAATAALFPSQFQESELGRIPKGWVSAPLDSIGNFLNGIALQKYPALPGEDWLPAIKIAQLRRGSTDGADRVSSAIPSQYLVRDGDLLFSWSGSLEVEIWCGGDGALNQHLFRVTSNSYPKWFLYLWLREHLAHFREIAESKVTTMGHIQRHHLRDALVVIPAKATLTKLGETLAPLFERMVQAKLQVRTLADLRDTLLPRLISGKLRVPEAEKVMEAVV